MKYAILSDVHANPVAFEAALADAREQGAEKILCLGDVVGYGPDPIGAVARVRAECDVVLMGNHDAAVADVIPYWNFIPAATRGVERHKAELNREDIAWLKSLPYTYATRTFLCAHGTADHPEEFGYILRVHEAEWAFRAMGERRLLFVGHTHAAMWVTRNPDGPLDVHGPEDFTLNAGTPYIVNVGSVGYPRNDGETIYVIYDTRTRRVVFRHLPFDFAGYVSAMESKKIQLPTWLGNFL